MGKGLMSRPEYPTSIRLTLIDKRRLRKQADKCNRSLAGLIQMILMQWLEKQEKNNNEDRPDNHDDQRPDGPSTLSGAGS
jgi:hypothetical protein